MTNAVVLLVRTVSKDYMLLYEKLLQPLRLTNPFKIPLHCVNNAKLLNRGHAGDTRSENSVHITAIQLYNVNCTLGCDNTPIPIGKYIQWM